MEEITRVIVEKKPGFNVQGDELLREIRDYLNIGSAESVRILVAYDILGICREDVEKIAGLVLADTNMDVLIFDEVDLGSARSFRYMSRPGSFDMRRESAIQCIDAILADDRKYEVIPSTIVAVYGDLKDSDIDEIRKYMINPLESLEVPVEKAGSISIQMDDGQEDTDTTGFTGYTRPMMESFRKSHRLAMGLDDLMFISEWFRGNEKRDPSFVELKILDVYWSDHCRHTTFNTVIDSVSFNGTLSSRIEESYSRYKAMREEVYGGRAMSEPGGFVSGSDMRPFTLMDMATISAKHSIMKGMADDIDISDEINACSIKVEVKTENGSEDHFLMFKNETHNHPTEIEPFGGASTCIGGAIRDPLSGRAYVYQSMRITGAGDPRESVHDTMKGKLPQRKICREAARGFSSYGNQIGIPAGVVHELYHDGYKAKRMEVGAVIGSVPASHVRRESLSKGDVIIMVGGRTGKDGCGGASGSSTSHSEASRDISGSEVQKGDAVEERKLQRLFRNPRFSKLVKKCNDFGAGGISVAIGEIADSVDIHLDRVLTKYDGLTSLELAISESQERMAIAVDREDAEAAVSLARSENLEAVVVAEVTDSGRMRMLDGGQVVADMSRKLIDTSGVVQHADVRVDSQDGDIFASGHDDLMSLLGSLQCCSRRGLVEMFDSSIGSLSVISPQGGKYQLTPAQAMVSRIPALNGTSSTCSVMTYGFDPDLSEKSPYLGAYYAVIQSAAKAVSSGADHSRLRLSFQEYFEKLGDDPVKWGKPFQSLLGAIEAMGGLGLMAIGGKDSMSGTFEDISVPPTLISFGVAAVDEEFVVSGELKSDGSGIYAYLPEADGDGMIDLESLGKSYEAISSLMRRGDVESSMSIGPGGIISTLAVMSFGNMMGFELAPGMDFSELSRKRYGGIIMESGKDLAAEGPFMLLGRTKDNGRARFGNSDYSLVDLVKSWESTLSDVYHLDAFDGSHLSKGGSRTEFKDKADSVNVSSGITRPRVIIPVFPGTNCEWDMARKFSEAGADISEVLVRNKTSHDLKESMAELVRRMDEANILAIPGGFSAGDEPDGSGKFIAAILQNDDIRAAIERLLHSRDGLALGICNGFQALARLGMFDDADSAADISVAPVLAFNRIGRHQAKISNIRAVQNSSPWMKNVDLSTIYKTPVSHGEGRFFAEGDTLRRLIDNNQIATVYADLDGRPADDGFYNPNGSTMAIEGIVSKDGKVLGKMGHTERVAKGLYKNIPDILQMDIFRNGVGFFTE